MNPELSSAHALLIGAIATAILIVVRFYFGPRSGSGHKGRQENEEHQSDTDS